MTAASLITALVLWAPALRAQLDGNLAWEASMLRLAAALLLARLAWAGLLHLVAALPHRPHAIAGAQDPETPVLRRRDDLADGRATQDA